MTILLSDVSEVKRLGRRLNCRSMTPELVIQLMRRKEALVAVYREGFRRRAQVVTDRKTFERLNARTIFSAIRNLRFYVMPLGIQPYRMAKVEPFPSVPALPRPRTVPFSQAAVGHD